MITSKRELIATGSIISGLLRMFGLARIRRMAPVVLLLYLTACQSTAPQPRSGAAAIATLPADIYLIPLDDFSYDTAFALAQTLSRDLGLTVKASQLIGSAGIPRIPGTKQYDADAVLDIAHKVAPSLGPLKTNTCFVILTHREVNTSSGTLSYLFSFRDFDKHAGVVSTGRLTEFTGVPAPSSSGWERTYKLCKRVIGEVYYEYRRSTDRNDVMFSPLNRLSDIDSMGSTYTTRERRDN